MNLATIAIPSENGNPARAKVTSLPDGSWTLAFATDGGRRVEPVGEPFDDVRLACRAAAALNRRTGQ
jgi:hypothetical protein